MLRSGNKTSETEVLGEGSLVCVYEGFSVKRVITLRRGGKLDTKHGRWRHEDFLGRRFGDRVTCTVKDRRYGDWETSCYLLRPTMELWTECLPHRTQIIYLPDISYICTRLALSAGKVVVEAGTGSGSLTHSLARAVAPTGKVFTFDFHAERSKAAREEFAQHGLEGIVTAAHRDVCTQRAEGMGAEEWGFGLPPGSADAVMLDVPSPWLACAAVHATLKDTGIFCNYSPCIEQVQKTCLALEGLRFANIQTVEVLRREYTEHSVRPKKLLPISERLAATGRKRARDDADAPAAAATAAEAAAAEVAEVEKEVETTQRCAIPVPTCRGHTAYLTFAYKTPA